MWLPKGNTLFFTLTEPTDTKVNDEVKNPWQNKTMSNDEGNKQMKQKRFNK